MNDEWILKAGMSQIREYLRMFKNVKNWVIVNLHVYFDKDKFRELKCCQNFFLKKFYIWNTKAIKYLLHMNWIFLWRKEIKLSTILP